MQKESYVFPSLTHKIREEVFSQKHAKVTISWRGTKIALTIRRMVTFVDELGYHLWCRCVRDLDSEKQCGQSWTWREPETPSKYCTNSWKFISKGVGYPLGYIPYIILPELFIQWSAMLHHNIIFRSWAWKPNILRKFTFLRVVESCHCLKMFPSLWIIHDNYFLTWVVMIFSIYY